MPSTPDLTLTQAERERFNTAVTNAGLQPASSWNNVINVTNSGPIPQDYVTVVEVSSLSQLNEIIGVPNSPFPAGSNGLRQAEAIRTVPRAAVANKSTLASTISPTEIRYLRWSLDAHVFGDSSQPSPNAELINTAFFPMQLTVVAAQSLTLAPGVTVTLQGISQAASNPYGYVLLILGSLSIGAGAQISSTANTVINSQVAYSAND